MVDIKCVAYSYIHAALVAQGRARKSKQNNGEVVCSRKRESCTTRFNVQDTDSRQSFYYTISTLKKFVLFYIIFAVWAFAAVRVHFIFVSMNDTSKFGEYLVLQSFLLIKPPAWLKDYIIMLLHLIFHDWRWCWWLWSW